MECVRCGCDDIRLLEINHKNGGGRLDNRNIIQRIRTKERKTDDLELLCRPCNAIHFIEKKFGEKFPLKVVWN